MWAFAAIFRGHSKTKLDRKMIPIKQKKQKNKKLSPKSVSFSCKKFSRHTPLMCRPTKKVSKTMSKRHWFSEAILQWSLKDKKRQLISVQVGLQCCHTKKIKTLTLAQHTGVQKCSRSEESWECHALSAALHLARELRGRFWPLWQVHK